MKFQPGKEYRTRDGRRARVYAVDGGSDNPIHGAVLGDNGWSARTWDSNGNWMNGGKSSGDLLPERQKIVRWVNIYFNVPEDFTTGLYHSKAEADQCSYSVSKRIACRRIEIEYSEGEYDD